MANSGICTTWKSLVASDNNVNIAGSNNLLERLDIHDAGDTGLQINSSSSLMPSNNLVLNCDSYLNADKSAEDADGFAAKLIIGPAMRSKAVERGTIAMTTGTLRCSKRSVSKRMLGNRSQTSDQVEA